MEFDDRLRDLAKQGYIIQPHSIIKNKEQIDGIRESAKINNGAHNIIS